MSLPPSDLRIPLAPLNAAPGSARRYRLLDVVRARLREGRYSTRAEEAYVAQIRRYVIYHGCRHPQLLGVDAVRNFLCVRLRVKDVGARAFRRPCCESLRTPTEAGRSRGCGALLPYARFRSIATLHFQAVLPN